MEGVWAGSRVNDFEADGTVVSRKFVFWSWISFLTGRDLEAKYHFSQADIPVLKNRDEIESF